MILHGTDTGNRRSNTTRDTGLEVFPSLLYASFTVLNLVVHIYLAL